MTKHWFHTLAICATVIAVPLMLYSPVAYFVANVYILVLFVSGDAAITKAAKQSGATGDEPAFVQNARTLVTTVTFASTLVWGSGLLGWWLGMHYSPPELLNAIFGF